MKENERKEGKKRKVRFFISFENAGFPEKVVTLLIASYTLSKEPEIGS